MLREMLRAMLFELDQLSQTIDLVKMIFDHLNSQNATGIFLAI